MKVGGESVVYRLSEADGGVVDVVLPKLKPGRYVIKVSYSGDEAVEGDFKDFGTIVVKDTKVKTKGQRGDAQRIGGPRL